MIRTVSLETAKLLKESGFRQEGSGFWYEISKSKNVVCSLMVTSSHSKYCEYFKAPTTDELLEELPNNIHVYRTESGYSCSNFTNPRKTSITFVGENSPDVCGQMWLYLNKKGLLK